MDPAFEPIPEPISGLTVLCEECGKSRSTYAPPREKKARWCCACAKTMTCGALPKCKLCEACDDKRAAFGTPEEKLARWCSSCAKVHYPGTYVAIDKKRLEEQQAAACKLALEQEAAEAKLLAALPKPVLISLLDTSDSSSAILSAVEDSNGWDPWLGAVAAAESAMGLSKPSMDVTAVAPRMTRRAASARRAARHSSTFHRKASLQNAATKRKQRPRPKCEDCHERTRNYGHPDDLNPASGTGRPHWRWCGMCAKKHPGSINLNPSHIPADGAVARKRLLARAKAKWEAEAAAVEAGANGVAAPRAPHPAIAINPELYHKCRVHQNGPPYDHKHKCNGCGVTRHRDKSAAKAKAKAGQKQQKVSKVSPKDNGQRVKSKSSQVPRMCEDCGVRTRNYGHPSDPNPASETGRPIWRWCGQCAKSYPGHVQRVRRLGPVPHQLLHRTAACGRAPP
jgi:hypothetical protein